MASITVLGQRRVLTELDVIIEGVEAKQQEQLVAVARLNPAGEGAAQLHALLRLTKDYLVCLRESRALLRWTLPVDESLHPGVTSAMEAYCPARRTNAAMLRPHLTE